MKKLLLILTAVFILCSCSGLDDEQVKKEFLKTCNGCKVIEVYSEECHDGSIFKCMLVKINYTQGNDSIKSVMCQYLKDENGVWHLSE